MSLPLRTSSLEQRASPLIGLPPLLVPRGETKNEMKTVDSPVPGLPPLMVPSVDQDTQEPSWKDAPPSYHLSAQSPSSSLSGRSTKLPALPSPPSEALPLPPTHALPPIPHSHSNGNGNVGTPTFELQPRSTSNGSTPRIIRSPSPLSPFSGHGEIKHPTPLDGLGLGPILQHRHPAPRAVSSPNPQRPEVQIIASSRAAHRDLPPIITHPPGRSVSSRTPGTQHQFPTHQLLSPGVPPSPGFSPTNVVVDSLIEEMAEDSPPRRERETSEGPVRKTSILDRPRPRTTSRGSSYRGDPITPTPLQTTFPASELNPYFRPSVKLTDIITSQRIQQHLLPHLSIASFLALLGALDKPWRRRISGETVGRWVVREWGLSIGDGGWPGLGVWEGFLESLLHTPDAYPSYSPAFHPLLRHLSLSHTLIVLFLRSLPPTAFPFIPPFPFEDDVAGTQALTSLSGATSVRELAHSASTLSLRQRTASTPSEYSGSGAGGRMPFVPKAERVVELVMPEPLSAITPDTQELLASPLLSEDANSKARKRRSSLGSASFVSWRDPKSPAASQSPLSPSHGGKGKHAAPPPVSFPSAKRYVFKGFGDPSFTHSRKRNSFDAGTGPGSIFSVDEAGRSLYGDSAAGSTFPSRHGLARHRFGEGQSLLSTKQSSSGGHHSPSTSSLARFAHSGGGYDDRTSTSSPTFGRLRASTPQPVEPAFQRPIPYVVGRCPILRVFVPLSASVPDWPCAEGAVRARHELERCGAWGKLRLGDVVINTALRDPLAPRHWMVFVPTVAPYLVPLEYRFSPTGHLPAYLNALLIPPSYYYPLLPAPYIIFPDLVPFADQALSTIRLAFERSDITTTRGEKVVAKRYLHVCGFEITPEAGNVACDEWHGMVTLEAEGTAEGRANLLRRLGRATNEARIPAQRGPWEIIREKSLGGTVWLRLVPDRTGPTSPA